MIVFLHDQFLESEDASLNISDLSMQRGYAAFDFFRTVNSKPLFLNDHLDRFYHSAEAMRLPVKKSKKEITDIIGELIKRISMPELGIRLMLSGGYSEDGYTIAEPNLLIAGKKLTMASQSDFEKGVSIITYEHQRELPHIKSINYMTAVWLQPVLKEKKADDVLYYDDTIITEFPRSNIFIITKDNILVTPSTNILLGITRKKILELGKTFLKTEERDISVKELLEASEVFMTSTTKRILPVVKIDGKVIGNGKPGEITTTLYQQFLEEENMLSL